MVSRLDCVALRLQDNLVLFVSQFVLFLVTKNSQLTGINSELAVCLANNCCIANTFESFEERFLRLYKRKAMLHHYDKFINARYVRWLSVDANLLNVSVGII